jgi:hypothetical protein
MIGAPTNSGILTDKEGTGFPGIRIDDKPFTVLNFVQRYLDAIPKKARVCYQITDGKISKIWQEDEQKSYGGQPVQGNKKDCTSNPTPFETSTPNTPALKTVEGQIVEIAPEAHKITVKDRTGALHTMVWAPPMHDQMSRLKQWWFTKITGEHVPDVDLWRLTATEFFKRPEDWPFKPAGGFGGKSFTPRNEKLIVLQSTLKACADVFAITTTPDSMDFDTAMDLIIARAIKDTDALMKAGVP